jgi:peroxiredoxin Q/BCP
VIEARGFREYHEAIENEGAVLVGISVDPPQSHRDFRNDLDLPYHLVSDEDKSVINLYGVKRRLPFLPNKRITYVVDKAGVIRGVFHHEIAIGHHRDDVLGALREINAT